MARERSSLRNLLEYAGVRAGLGMLRALPPAAAMRLAERLGDLAYRVDRKHREVTLANLARVYGGAPADHVALARAAFRNFVRVGAEFVLLPDLVAARGFDAVFAIEGAEHVAAAKAGGTGVIAFSAHLGNWEALAFGAAPLGLTVHSVGRRLDNPRLDAFLFAERGRYARSVIPKEGALPKVVRALRSGDWVAMLLDQHAGRQGVVVDFLGFPASTFRAPAELAVRFGIPLVGAYGLRVDPAPRFRLVFEPPLRPEPGADPEAEVRRLTQAMSDSIARRVRAHPEQWNWLHRRWRDARQAAPSVAGGR